MTDQFDPKSLHGRAFTATICFDEVIGRVSVRDDGVFYLCQDSIGDTGGYCRDFFGYKYAYFVNDMHDLLRMGVVGLKILPPVEEYHKLLVKIHSLSGVENLRDAVLEIEQFLASIPVFDPKNPSND